MLFTLKELYDHLPKASRLLGIDPGKKQIGLALSDLSLMLASPYKTLKRGKIAAFAQEVKTLQEREPIGGMVIGFPVSMDGTIGPAAQAVRDWALAVSEATNLPFTLWDERLSSSAVNRMLIADMDVSRKKRAEVVDKLAASYILQAALDAIPRP